MTNSESTITAIIIDKNFDNKFRIDTNSNNYVSIEDIKNKMNNIGLSIVVITESMIMSSLDDRVMVYYHFDNSWAIKIYDYEQLEKEIKLEIDYIGTMSLYEIVVKIKSLMSRSIEKIDINFKNYVLTLNISNVKHEFELRKC